MKLSKKQIKSFDELYHKTVDPDSLISTFILGHLMIEFLLVKIIKIQLPKLLNFAESLNHNRLISLVYGLGNITDAQKTVLENINSMRNKFAHELTFLPSMEELRKVYKEAKDNFSDMTDGLEQGLEELNANEKLEDCESYIFSELFIQISYDLHDIYQDLGGDIKEF